MEPREWQDEILQAAKPIIQLSAIGFDGDSPTCVQAAHDLGMVLDESVVSSADGEEELLSEAVPIGAIAVGAPGLGIGDLTSKALDANAWNHLSLFGLPTKSRRADGRKLLQLYLLLSARYICEESSREVLIRGLQSCIDHYAACTVLFVEEEAIKSDRPIDSEQAQAWINQFDVLSPCRIAAFYVATRLESGQPVSRNEIAESLAVLIAGDILCNPDSGERLLTPDPHTDVRTFGAVGSRVIRFAPHRLAEAIADRTVDALLRATVFNDADVLADLPLDSLPPAPAVLDRVVERSVAEHVDLKLAGSHSRAGHGVVGYNHVTDSAFAGGIDFKTEGFKIGLDDLPRSDWLDALFEWDFLHHQEVVRSWLDGLDDAFHAVGNDVITATDQRVIDHVKEHPRLDKAAESVSRAASVARSGYRLSLTPTQSSELNVSLERLRECLAAIPHAPSLVARVLVLIMLQGIAGWTF